jgi:hypothetical protein
MLAAELETTLSLLNGRVCWYIFKAWSIINQFVGSPFRHIDWLNPIFREGVNYAPSAACGCLKSDVTAALS